MLVKSKGRRRRRWQRMRWVAGITHSMGMSLSKLREIVKDKEAWGACSPWGHKELDMTERLDWTSLLPQLIQTHTHTNNTHHIEKQLQGEKARQQEIILGRWRCCLKMEGGMRRWLRREAKEAEPSAVQWAAWCAMHSWLLVMVTGYEGKGKEMTFKTNFHFTFSICGRSLMTCNQSMICKIIKLLH